MSYHASGGVVFKQEHVPMTMEAAHVARSVHIRNRDHWLSRDDLAWSDALAMAKAENDLADELARAIEAARSDTKEAA